MPKSKSRKHGSRHKKQREKVVFGSTSEEINLKLFVEAVEKLPYEEDSGASPRLEEESAESSSGSSYSDTESLPAAPSVFKKERLAPRSGSQFKVGPHFEGTVSDVPLFCSRTGALMRPIISARVDRGFEKTPEGDWIGYKRNYFTLVTAFGFENVANDEAMNESLFMNLDGREVTVRYLALKIFSTCCEDGSDVSLVQHTAKRDKGPQSEPATYPAIPGVLPDHQTIKDAANIRNNNKIAALNRIFYLPPEERREYPLDSLLSFYPTGDISLAVRYERIQFSSSINYRKSSVANRHFILGVQLLAYTDDNTCVTVAHSITSPLVIRGRSPSNYQGNSEKRHILIKPEKVDAPTGVERQKSTGYVEILRQEPPKVKFEGGEGIGKVMVPSLGESFARANMSHSFDASQGNIVEFPSNSQRSIDTLPIVPETRIFQESTNYSYLGIKHPNGFGSHVNDFVEDGEEDKENYFMSKENQIPRSFNFFDNGTGREFGDGLAPENFSSNFLSHDINRRNERKELRKELKERKRSMKSSQKSKKPKLGPEYENFLMDVSTCFNGSFDDALDEEEEARIMSQLKLEFEDPALDYMN